MGRILEALKQIEARSSQPRQRPKTVPLEELDSHQPPPREDRPSVDREIGPPETVREDAAFEAALAEAEIAAGIIAQQQEAPPPDSQTARWPIQPTEELARAYGELADNILSQVPSGRPAALMFTSPGDGEGKTGMLVWLAVALAERSPGGVLAVDGNFRKPDLAGWMGVEAARGLADVLMGVASWQQVVQRTDVQRLSILPGVKFPAPDGRPPERLNLGPLLKALSRQYRLILIDTASLAHREVAPIARYCDGTYLVVRLKYTTRRAVAEAVRVIQDCRGRLLGSVVIGD